MDGPGRGLIGLGHDIQAISEFESVSALRECDVFFTSGELRRFAATAAPVRSLAGGFAAKEALFKALPAGETWFWTDAELVHDEHGAPGFTTHGTLARSLRHRNVSVSISHSGGLVSAVVIITGGQRQASRLFGTIDRAVRHVLRRITAHAAGTP